MKPIKLTIKTKSETYPIIIGNNLVKNLSKILSRNSINFDQCLLVVDKKIPKKKFIKLQNLLKEKKFLDIILKQMKKIKIKIK